MWRPWEVLDGESTEDDRDSKEKEEEEGRLVGVGDDERRDGAGLGETEVGI